MGFLASAAVLLKAAFAGAGTWLASGGSALVTGFGSTLGSGLASFVLDHLNQSGQQTLATELQTNPTRPTLVAAQNVLTQQMTANATFRQAVETRLQTASPTDWQWAQTTGAAVTDWNGYFDDILDQIRRPRADRFRSLHPLSNEQYQHELTGRCPVGGEIALVRYYRPQGQWFYEVSLSSWLSGPQEDPYATTLTPGSYAQCYNDHRWSIYR